MGIRAQVDTMKRAYLRGQTRSQLCGSYRRVTIIIRANNNYLCGTRRRRGRGGRLRGKKAIWPGERNHTHPAASFLRTRDGGKPRTPRWLYTCVVHRTRAPATFLYCRGGGGGGGVSGQRGNRLATPLD